MVADWPIVAEEMVDDPSQLLLDGRAGWWLTIGVADHGLLPDHGHPGQAATPGSIHCG